MKQRLKRTSVQLPGVQFEWIAAEAEKNGESGSEIIRRAIDRYFFLGGIAATPWGKIAKAIEKEMAKEKGRPAEG